MAISAEIKAWLTLAAVLAAVVGGSLFWAHYSGLKAELKEAKAAVTVLEESLRVEKETTKKLGEDLKTANEQVALTKGLYTASENARLAQVRENTNLNKKIKQFLIKLPAPVKDNKASPETPEEKVNSFKRITTLWDVYCATQPENDKCVLLMSPKPSVSLLVSDSSTEPHGEGIRLRPDKAALSLPGNHNEEKTE